MLLIVGGMEQGQREYLAQLGYLPDQIARGGDCPLDEIPAQPVLDKLHLVIRRLMEAGQDPVLWVDSYCRAHPHWVITCDEVGAGIVPLDPFEREWREQCGRICCTLASSAQKVVRVCAGIPMVIKGE